MPESPSLSSLVAEVVAAYVAHHKVDTAELPELIQKVHASFLKIEGGTPAAPHRPEPAIAIKKSVTPDYIVCLEDGKKMKMLKRHLKTAYNMTPEQYRERWGLSADYPMVAPNYAKERSKLAHAIGLGTQKK